MCGTPEVHQKDGAPIQSTIWRETFTQGNIPLEKNDHPELDTSPPLDDDGISKY
jgi:hypothetical protein